LYASLCNNIKQYNKSKIEFWEQGVEANTENQLNKSLLYIEESSLIPEGLVRVNFDPILIKLLREVKYLTMQDYEVPERASLLY
jgi:dynein heavy chain